jgi:dihydroflavonol-4-reductase
MTQSAPIQSAFVTGSTGLLGNNLVRLLVSRGVTVKALARCTKKAERQFAGLPVEIIEGDMNSVAAFAGRLRDVTILFHAAAFFRDNYKGGRHWKQLYDTNVTGTVELLTRAYNAGIRRFVHTSSVAVLTGAPGQLGLHGSSRLDGRPRRYRRHFLGPSDADDYYLSKILTDRQVRSFLDFLHRKLPGIPPASFSVVDARDVAEAHWLAAVQGQRGERYIAAGRHMSTEQLFHTLEKLSGIPFPKFKVPSPVLFAMGAATELYARLGGKPALIRLATLRLMMRERNRTHFSHEKSRRELGLLFRPVEETLRDTIAWYAENGGLQKTPLTNSALHPAGVPPC